jgi:endonuclease G
MNARREDIFKQIASNGELWSEIMDRASAPPPFEFPPSFGELEGLPVEGVPPPIPQPRGLEDLQPDVLGHLKETPADLLLPENLFVEAIVRKVGRPVLKVRNDDFDLAELDTDFWKSSLEQHRAALRSVIRSVGRIELVNNPYFTWVGTGWVVADDVIVTNRHVASEFAKESDGRFVFRQSLDGVMKARLDFREEYLGEGSAEFELVEVLHIEEDRGPDLAFLRIDWTGSGAGAPRAPLPLASMAAVKQPVAVIGYPAKDSRTYMPDEMDRIFGDIYDVKRLAPGEVMQVAEERGLFAHDCTTLGGNSGSVICDMETGQALGLHFGGKEEWANYAVSSAVVKARLAEVMASRRLPPVHVPVVVEEAAPTAASLQDRTGYAPDFLGQPVPLPRLASALRKQVAPVEGREDGLLHYTHYSVMMHRARRMAIYAVCNIDGRELRRVLREQDNWYLDPRMDTAHQAGNELYKNNTLDRGHLVRRLDPGWGATYEEAEAATLDTFFYTNCAPQHEQLNRDLWLGLEDYILTNTDAYDLRVTVFNGPVFRSKDLKYRDFKIPQDFWKVVAMVREETGQLSVTAYLLSQRSLLDDLEFAFAAYSTYQVPVRQIERLTRLNFGNLKSFDPLAEQEAAAPFVPLASLADIRL